MVEKEEKEEPFAMSRFRLRFVRASVVKRKGKPAASFSSIGTTQRQSTHIATSQQVCDLAGTPYLRATS